MTTKDDEGVLFANRYLLQRKLAEGGMAEIFLARQVGIGGFQKDLVIKRIHGELAAQEQYIEMFLDEARIAADLNHPNIVHIYDIGRAEGTYFIAMEYIRGADLMEICRAGIKAGNFVPLRHAVKIISQVSEGLTYAHDKRGENGRPLGIVHRDISPTNILVTYGGVAKLVDFGIAKATNQVRDDSGLVMGKINYMAPEQLRGQDVDRRADLFSLGVVLYETTAGRRLFKGKGVEAARKILREPVPPPSIFRPGYPPDLEVIVMRCLEKNPDSRYPDASELHSDLEDFLAEANLKTGTQRIARYLRELFDIEELAIELREEVLDDDIEEEDLDFDSRLQYDEDFAADEPIIFASRIPDEQALSADHEDDEDDYEPGDDARASPAAPPRTATAAVAAAARQPSAGGGTPAADDDGVPVSPQGEAAQSGSIRTRPLIEEDDGVSVRSRVLPTLVAILIAAGVAGIVVLLLVYFGVV